MKSFSHPSEIKVGIVGYGGAFAMGKKHMTEAKKAGMSPTAVCDPDPKCLNQARDDFKNIETYPSLTEMLRKSDANLIIHITPHNLHYKLAAQCLRAGRHVVTEKPFVITTSEADRLITLAKQKRKLVTTYHNRHWDGCILRAKREIVDKGAIGDIFRVEAHMDAFGGYAMPNNWWRTSKSISGGVLYDWGVHLLEYALQLVPGKIVEVSGFAKQGFWASQAPKGWPWKKDCNEDEAHAIVRFDSGVMLHLSVSHLRSDTASPYAMAVVGTKGSYEFGPMGDWRTNIANRKGKLIEKKGKNPKDQALKFYQNISDHLCGKDKLVITPQWARRPIHILDLADRSARQGKTLKAKYH